jgi:peptidoglycan-associated lipoprotein
MTIVPSHLVKLSTVLALTALGCATGSSVSKSQTPQEPVAQATPAPAPQPAAAPAPAEPVALKSDSVFFDFDQSQLQPAGQEYLSSLGAVLAKHPEVSARIEGNCDERGTVAYNMALGAKRAEAAKQYLVQMGVKDSQLTTVSNGKEKPRAQGHDEKAWSQNRRSDVIPSQASISANP